VAMASRPGVTPGARRVQPRFPPPSLVQSPCVLAAVRQSPAKISANRPGGFLSPVVRHRTYLGCPRQWRSSKRQTPVHCTCFTSSKRQPGKINKLLDTLIKCVTLTLYEFGSCLQATPDWDQHHTHSLLLQMSMTTDQPEGTPPGATAAATGARTPPGSFLQDALDYGDALAEGFNMAQEDRDAGNGHRKSTSTTLGLTSSGPPPPAAPKEKRSQTQLTPEGRPHCRGSAEMRKSAGILAGGHYPVMA